MGLFKRNKFKKLKREDVVNAIVTLQEQLDKLEEVIATSQAKIEELMKKGTAEKDRDMKIFYAKQINALKAQKQNAIKRSSYLMYNIRLLERVKDTIDDNDFFRNTSAASLNGLLADQKGLADFLRRGLATKMGAEQALVAAERTFDEIEAGYVESEEIYGIRDNDDELLAMFEMADPIADEGVADAADSTATADTTED